MPNGLLESLFLLILAFLVLSNGFQFSGVVRAIGSQSADVIKVLQGR